MSALRPLWWQARRLWQGARHTLRHPRARAVHLSRSRALAGPGAAGFAGGVFNPGAVATDDGGFLVLAKGQHVHWARALAFEPSRFMDGAPVLWNLRADLSRSEPARIAAPEGFASSRVRIEDFRMFRHGGRTLVNHVVRDFDERGARLGVRQALSALDTAGPALRLIGFPRLDIALAHREKNWVYLDTDGELLLFYSFSPLRVLRLVDDESLTFASVINRDLTGLLADPGRLGSLVSFSTNPVPYDAERWFLLIHQVDASRGYRRYLHWGVLLDRTTLAPTHITAEPLFDGRGARCYPIRGVLYVTAVLATESGFVFLNGEGDRYVTRIHIERGALDVLWVKA